MTAENLYFDDTGMAHADEKITRLLGRAISDGLCRVHPRNARDMLAAEKARSASGGLVADLLVARDIARAHLDSDFVGGAMAECREHLLRRVNGVRRVKDAGRRIVAVRLANGLVLGLPTPYLRPSRKGLRGRPRGSGKRRSAGMGAYPVLEALGVGDHVTPLTRSDIARQTVVSCSYAEARDQLVRGGLDVSDKTLVNIAVRTGLAALERRDEALERARRQPLPSGSPFAGKRIRVSVDGGRARTRQTHFGTATGKNGRRNFTLAWREPRIITVDVFDDDGVIDRKWRPIYETTLGAADAVFALLSASTCRRTDHLEPLLYLRAIAKSGRWDDFMTAWLDNRHWLQPKNPAMETQSSLAA